MALLSLALLGLVVSAASALVVAAADSSAQSKAQAHYLCDGSGDQVQIQQALTAAGSGGVVTLTEGTFNLNGDLNVPSGVTLEGKGADATTLAWTSGMLRVSSRQNVVLRNFKTTGTGAIFLYNSNHIKVQNVTATVDNSHNTEGAFQIWASNAIVEDIEFNNCRAIDCGRHGFMNDGDGSPKLLRNIRYIDCQAINSGRYSRFSPYGQWTTGFDLAENTDIEDSQVIRCLAEGSFESGFHFEGRPKVTNVVFRDCVARNNGVKPDDYYNPDEATYGAHFGSGYLVHGSTQLVNCTSEKNQRAGYILGSGSRALNCTDSHSLIGFVLAHADDVHLADCRSNAFGALGILCLDAANISMERYRGEGPVANESVCVRIGPTDGLFSAEDRPCEGLHAPRAIWINTSRSVRIAGVVATDLQDPLLIENSSSIDTSLLQFQPLTETPSLREKAIIENQWVTLADRLLDALGRILDGTAV